LEFKLQLAGFEKNFSQKLAKKTKGGLYPTSFVTFVFFCKSGEIPAATPLDIPSAMG